LNPRSSSVGLPKPLPEEFAEALARGAGRLGVFSHRQFLWYETVPSTNDLAAALAERGAREGCAVIADAQSAGRGRQGRAWSSPAGSGLYVSTILRPPTHALGLLTIAAGVAVAEAIQSSTGLDPQLKWPNDVYLGERKVAGLLAEAGSLVDDDDAPTGGPTDQSGVDRPFRSGADRPHHSAADRPHHSGADLNGPRVAYVIVGIGINIMPASHPPEVAARATSIEEELGRRVDRGLLLTECLANIAARYAELLERRTAGVLTEWRARSRAAFGRTVEFDGGTRRGVAEDLDESGALVVRTDSGIEHVISGEVRWM
jgi:BirA family transcriptional regulator, biotin operon repressor / biotin---[acetyl-CoA-carboxylase] ligase